MEQTKKRLDFLDVAKFIGIVLMIYVHARGQGQETLYFSAFHMPLFFIISGMTFRIKEGESAGDFLVRKIKSFIIPFIVLALMITFCDMAIEASLGTIVNWKYFIDKLVYIWHSSRPYPLWFVLALFFGEIWLYLFIRLSFKKDWLVFIYSLISLTLIMLFYHYFPQKLAHSFDASFVAVFLICLGYLFYRPWNSKPREWILSSRLKSFIIGALLLGICFGITFYLFKTYENPWYRFDMWGNAYKPAYWRIPAAIAGSFGLIFVSNTISNKVMGYFGRHTLVILAFQQNVTIKIFQKYVAVEWFKSIGSFTDGKWPAIAFTLTCTLFSLAVLIPASILLTETHIAYIFCKKPAKWYLNLLNWISTNLHKTA